MLFNKFSLNNNILKEIKNKNKGKYCIPIVIDKPVGGNKYKFTVGKEMCNLKLNTFYQCPYKMIKFCESNVWNKICSVEV